MWKCWDLGVFLFVDVDDAVSRRRGSVRCLISFGSLVVAVEYVFPA
jgi:hypothetical protein